MSLYASCKIYADDSAQIQNIKIYTSKEKFADFKNIDELLAYCKQTQIEILIFYNGKIDFSYFDYWLLTNKWQKAKNSKPGQLRRGEYKMTVGGNGERYITKIGLGKFTVHLRNLSMIAKGGLEAAARDFDLEYCGELETTLYLAEVIDDTFYDLTKRYWITTDQPFLTLGALSKGELEDYIVYRNKAVRFHDVYPLNVDKNKMLCDMNIVRGGVCAFNPIYQGFCLTDCRKYDYNSAYPYIMKNYPMPYGNFKAYREIRNNNNLKFIMFKSFKGYLRPGMVPVHNHFITGQTLTYISYREAQNFTLWEDELTALKNYYIIEYETAAVWEFTPRIDPGMGAFVDKYYEMKLKSTGARKRGVKLILNNAFGKLGENIYRNYNYYELDESGRAVRVEEEVDHSENNSLRYLNILLSSYIASQGRARILNDIYKYCGSNMRESLVYVDTDCIVVRGVEIPSSDLELGAFKDEGHFTSFKFLNKKTYIGYQDNRLITAHAPGVDNKTLTDFFKQQNEEDGINAFNCDITFECPIYNLKVGGLVLESGTRKLSDMDARRINGILIKEI